MKETRKNNKKSFIVQRGRQAGVGLHISSLPGSHGIGDIAESSLAFLDTLVEMGVGVWQFLPTGPTAYGDSPYQPLSAFAGNAMLLGTVAAGRARFAGCRGHRSRCGHLPRDHVDFGRLIPAKRALLKKAAQRFSNRPANGLVADYEDFLHQHGDHWLDDYALFRVLKTLHGERPWPEWDKSFVHREPAALRESKTGTPAGLDRTRITQFLFWRQWQELRAAATR